MRPAVLLFACSLACTTTGPRDWPASLKNQVGSEWINTLNLLNASSTELKSEACTKGDLRTVVAFTLDRAGGISGPKLASSSGNKRVDTAALEVMGHIEKVTPPPSADLFEAAETREEKFTFTLLGGCR